MSENKDVFTSKTENAETERLRKVWFNHVIFTLEKLAENIDKTNSELYNKTSELYKEIQSVKDLLYSELKDVNRNRHNEIYKLEKRVNELVDSIECKIKNLSVPSVKEELKKDITNLKDDFTEKLNFIKVAVTKINVKLTMWALFAGVIGGWIIPTGIKWFFSFISLTSSIP